MRPAIVALPALTSLSSAFNRISPSYPRRRQLEKVREGVPDRADGFCAVTFATVYQMQRGPFFDQRIKAQRHLGAFALRVAPHAKAPGALVDPFGHVAETSPGSCSGLLGRDASPHSYGLADFPLGRRIGPLHDEGAGFRCHPHTAAAALAVEDETIFAARFER